MSGLIRRKHSAEAADDDEFMTLQEAAQYLRLDESTIRKRRAGTESFTHVHQGRPGSKRPRTMLLRSEVVLHRRQLIAAAREKNSRAIEMVFNS